MVPPPVSKQLKPTAISGLEGDIVVWRNDAMQAIKLETAVIDLDRPTLDIVCSISSHHCTYTVAEWALRKIYSANITIHASMQITTMATTKKINSRFE